MHTINLGAETDNDLFERPRTAIIDLGGSTANPECIVGGSQEVTTYKIVLPAGTIEAIAETYVGLSLTGDEALIGPLAQRVKLGLPPRTNAVVGSRVAPR